MRARARVSIVAQTDYGISYEFGPAAYPTSFLGNQHNVRFFALEQRRGAASLTIGPSSLMEVCGAGWMAGLALFSNERYPVEPKHNEALWCSRLQ